MGGRSQRQRMPWYRQGLRFECQRCGKCCTGAPGYVDMSRTEAQAMAEYLGLSLEEFRQRYIRTEYKAHWLLREVESDWGLDCIMLEREAEPPHLARCRVHQCRPTQCRTWPFWPENLYTPEDWDEAAERCAGMNRGELFPYKDIRAKRDESGIPLPEE